MNYLFFNWLRKLQYLHNCRDFDREYYLKKYPDVAKAGVDPLEHYKKYGRYEGRFSSLTHELECTMDQKDYINRYPDVIKSGLDPIVHYVQLGEAEGRKWIKRGTPKDKFDELKRIRQQQYSYNCRNFDREYYLKKYPDVAKTGIDPLEHYKKYGRYEGRFSSSTHELECTMDQKDYINRYPDVIKSGLDPIVHYVQQGKAEGKEWIKRGTPKDKFDELKRIRQQQYVYNCRNFDSEYYLKRYPDVAKAGVDPLEHYKKYGRHEGRYSSPVNELEITMNQRDYLRRYPDLAKASTDPLIHYLQTGMSEGRKIVQRGVIKSANPADYGYATTKYITSNKQLEPGIAAEDASKIICVDALRERIKAYRCNKKKNRIAIFTAISNNYDSLKIPSFISNDYDYICFSNTDMSDTGIWEIRPCLYLSSDPTRITRYVKTHAHCLLSEYEVAVWIDSNIVITGDITEEIERTIASGLPCATFYHPRRENIYEEAETIIRAKRDDPEIVKLQVGHIGDFGLEHNDLAETNFMIFNLRHEKIKKFLNTWWSEIDTYSKRDQLSFNYSLYKNGTRYYPLAEKYVSARNYSKLVYCRHDHTAGSSSLLLNSVFKHKIDPYQGDSFYKSKEVRISSVRDKSIDVIICVHNALVDFKNCIESVFKARRFNEYKVIIVDDGSDEETRDFIASLPAEHLFVSVTRNKVAEGYTKAANKGLSLSVADFVILLNSDTIVSEGWAEKLASALFSTPNAGIVGPLSNAASWQSIPSNQWINTKNPLPKNLSIEDVNNFLEKWTSDGCFPKVPLINGFCYGISREVVNRVGYFDDINFAKGYGEEDDYSFRARKHGFDLIVATNTYIFHAKTKSYDKSVAKALITSGGKNLRGKHGTVRISRAIRDMKENPILHMFRVKAELLFDHSNLKSKILVIPDMGLGFVRFLPYFQAKLPFVVYNAFPDTAPYLPTIGSYDIVFTNRLFNGFGSNSYLSTWATKWKKAGGKIIYDLDDDFFDAEEIAARLGVSVQEAQGNLEKIKSFLKFADTVTVSTSALQEKVLPYNSSTFLVRDVLDAELWDLDSDEIAADKKADGVIRIGYIGTPTHAGNIDVVAEAARKIESEYKGKIIFEFVGAFNNGMPPFGTNIPVGNTYYPAFVRWLIGRIDWDIGIIPLAESSFNKEKSDLKFLEYSALGLAIAVSDVPTYHEVIRNEENCLAVENTTDAWYATLKRMIEDDHLRLRLAKNAKRDVRAFSAQNNIDIYEEIISTTLNAKK